MSYVDSVVVGDETVLAKGRTHWFIYVMPGFWFTMASLLCIMLSPHWIGGMFMAVSAIYLLGAWIYSMRGRLRKQKIKHAKPVAAVAMA